MSGDSLSVTCIDAERDLLNMIVCLPGVPAIVTIEADGPYSVPTSGGWWKGGVIAARAKASITSPQGANRVSYDHSTNAARRLIALHFGQFHKARITVPPRPDKEDKFRSANRHSPAALS